MSFKIENKKIHAIGKLPIDQYDLIVIIKDQKGKWMTTVSKKLDFIIKGDNASAKMLDKIAALNIPLISYNDFRKMLNEDFLTFTLEDISGEETPEQLLTILSEKNWNLWMRPQTKFQNAEKLILLLKQLEFKFGVTEVHKYCSAKLTKALCLKIIHPFHHTSKICNHDISPDNKYLATSCSVNKEFEDRRAIVQIWDLEFGKVVNQFKIAGGVGALKGEDTNGIRWSPDSKKIAINVNLNGVAVYTPNGEVLSEAYITNGNPLPLIFYWTNNSEFVMIDYPYYEKLKISEDQIPEKNITWMPAEVPPPKGTNNRSSQQKCIPGKETDFQITKKTKARSGLVNGVELNLDKIKGAIFYELTDRIIVIAEDSIHFFDNNGVHINKQNFYNWSPISKLTLMQRNFTCSPVFPLHENPENENGEIVSRNQLKIPKNYNYKQNLSLSFCRYYYWPWNWYGEIEIVEKGSEWNI